MNTPDSDIESDARSENLQIIPETGMSSDYFNNLNLIPMFMTFVTDKTLSGVVRELATKPQWEVITYSDFVAKKSPLAQTKLKNAKALSRIEKVNTCIKILQAEITKIRESKTMDEDVFRSNWYTAYELIF